jgi:hypothetical protein
MPKPHNIVDTLQWWLSEQFDDEFGELGGSLDHGLQEDFTSCAFVAVNMMAHRVFNEPLWNYSRAAYERAHWFVNVINAHKDSVSDEILSAVNTLTKLSKDEARVQQQVATTSFMGPKSMRHLMNSDQQAQAGQVEQSMYSKPAEVAHTQHLSFQDLLNPAPPSLDTASSSDRGPCSTSAASSSPSLNLTSISEDVSERRDTSVEMVSDCEIENGAASSTDLGTRMSIDEDSVADAPAASTLKVAPSLPKKTFPIFSIPTLQQIGHK